MCEFNLKFAGDLSSAEELDSTKKASTILCSQFEVSGWHQKIGDATLAEAICDRIVHDSYTIVIGGVDSIRKRKGIAERA